MVFKGVGVERSSVESKLGKAYAASLGPFDLSWRCIDADDSAHVPTLEGEDRRVLDLCEREVGLDFVRGYASK